MKTKSSQNTHHTSQHSEGISLIALVITIIVVIILAAIAFGTSTRTITNANYSDYVNNVSEVYNAFHRRAVTIKGQEAAKGNNVTDAQVYDYLAKNGQTQDDFLVRAKLPAYTIITDDGQIGMKLPKMRVESGTGKMLDVQYAVTSEGDIFTWPPFDYEEKFKISADDTAEEKYVATTGTVTVKGKEIAIETGEKGELLPAGAAGSIQMASVSVSADSDGNITANVSNVDMENVQSIQYSLDNSSWQNDNTFEVNTSGDYTVYAKLRDNEGNEVTKSGSTNVVIVAVENSIKNLVKTGALKIGDYINYNTFLTAKNYTSPENANGSGDQVLSADTGTSWRVIYMDNSKIWITPANPVSTVKLMGAKGYINGPAELHKICRELYSSSSLGTTASNMTIEDFETALSASGDVATKLATAKANYSNSNSSNGGINGTKEYTSGNYFIENGNGVSGGTVGDTIPDTSLKYYKASNTDTGKVTATQTYYNYTSSSVPSPVWNVLSGTRWLASPCVNLNSSDADFYVRRVISSRMGAYRLAYSGGGAYSSSNGVCPLVSLSSMLQLDAGTATTHSTQANAWKISN